MKNTQQEQAKIPCDYYEFKSFSGVVIIPIKNNDPVLIFKDYGARFYLESGGSENKRKGFEEPVALNNYMVYWEGKYLNHNLPEAVFHQYGDFFSELIDTTPLPTHLKAEDFPQECVEIPIPLLKSEKIRIHESEQLTYTKKILRKLGFLSESRGKNKKPNKFRQRREELIVLNYIQTGRKKPYLINKIQNLTFDCLYNEYPNKSEDEIMISDDQIRRILNKYTERSRTK